MEAERGQSKLKYQNREKNFKIEKRISESGKEFRNREKNFRIGKRISE